MFIVAVFTIVKIRKQPMCPSTGEWIKNMQDKINTHIMVYDSAPKSLSEAFFQRNPNQNIYTLFF